MGELFYQTCVNAKVAQAHSGLLQVNSYVTLLFSPCTQLCRTGSAVVFFERQPDVVAATYGQGAVFHN